MPNLPASSRSRRWRIVLATLGVLALLAVGGSIALTRAFPPQRVAALLAEQVRAATGRDFRIGGGLSLRLLPSIAVVAEELTFGNAPWGSRPQMATIQRAAFEVAIEPLLHGQLRVLRVDIDGADVLLETDARGHANWIFGEPDEGGAKAPAPAAQTSAVELDELTLSNARIAYRVGASQTTQTLDIASLQLVKQGERTAVALQFAGRHRGWKLEGQTGHYDALVRGGADWPFDLRLVGDGIRLSAKGSFDAGGTLQASVNAHVERAAALVPLIDNLTALPMPIDASATIKRTPTSVTADALRVSLAGQTLNGRVTVLTRPSGPQFEIDAHAATLDLARWGVRAAGAASAPAPAGHAPLFSDASLPKIALPELPLRANLRVDQLAMPGWPTLGALQAQVRLEPGRLLVDMLSFALANGRVQARAALTARPNEPLRLQLRGDARGLSLEALDALRGAPSRFRGGQVALQADLAASGRTPHDLAASLDGQALLTVRDAALVGGAAIERNVLIAVLQTLLPKQESDKALSIECAVVRLPLHHGVARIDRSIAMETDKVSMAASGELNLAAQSVSLTFQPVVKKGIGIDSSANLAKLVMLEGPLQDPKVGIDMKGTAREAANIGAAVATGGLTLVGKRLLSGPPDTQACKRALGPAAPRAP
jgi:hypothetical protein